MIKLLVVDDQRLVRRCIIAKLNSVPRFQVTGEAASGEKARELLRHQSVDVVLMDLNMPGIGGIEATKRFLSVDPGLKIVGLSMYTKGLYPRRFLEAGGMGYVSKSADSDDLFKAVDMVYVGQPFISRDVAQEIAIGTAKENGDDVFDALSVREIQVLQKISNGLNLEEIASVLCLSPKTVAHHRRSLYRKLDVANDVQLVNLIREQGGAELASEPVI
ncbi:MAG: response regulator [Gammaproteobacteria bacterium]